MTRPDRPGVRRLFRIDAWRRADAERDIRDEMDLHVSLRAEQLRRDGRSPAEALAEARRLFAHDEATIDELHRTANDRNQTMRFRERWDSLRQDTRYAARRLRREPGATAFILATLAFGIGMNVAAFNVVDRVLLSGPQHVSDPQRLVRFYSRTDTRQFGSRTLPWLPYSTMVTLKGGMPSIGGIAAYRVDDMMVGTGADSRRRQVGAASGELFPLLGVRPLRGRFFGPDEDAANIAVVSEGYWESVTGRDERIAGRTIVINDAPHTIVGVAPAGFTGVGLSRVDAWTPIAVGRRNSQNFQMVARLAEGGSVAAALADLERQRASLEASLPSWAQWLRGATYLAAPISYNDEARESFTAVMARWLAAITAIILLISCANVANLMLARLARRRRELSVRTALGAGRGRVLRLLALEGVLLAVGAAVVAIPVAAITEPAVRDALFPGGGWSVRLLDLRVAGVTLTLTLLTAAFISVVPAMKLGRHDLSAALRSGARAGDARSVTRWGLTVVQAMFSVVLLVGAGLFLRSLQRVHAVDLGFEADRVIVVEVAYARMPRAPGEAFQAWVERTSAIERERHRALAEVARSVPGVERASVSVGLPFAGGVTLPLRVPGRDSVPTLPGGGPWVTAVDPGYFATIGATLRAGRVFGPQDRESSERVVIVGEAMAQTLWPGGRALDKCVQVGGDDAPCARVVGVVGDLHRTGIREQPSTQFYVPIGQERGFSGSYLLVRPTGPARSAWPSLTRALSQADRAIRSLDVRVLSDALEGEIRPFRLGVVAFGLSAALALVVAGLGLFSIMAHAVAWRRHEIGVRLALGARPASIARLVARQGLSAATVGIIAGLVIALAARRSVEPQLFETSGSDPVVLVSVVAALEAVALLAAWVPARRAVAVSPTETLRAE